MTGVLAVLGDALLDRDVDGAVRRVSPDAPVPVLEEGASTVRPGGAALAAILAARDGHQVLFVTALADDQAGRQLRRLLEAAGVEVVAAPSGTPTPEKVRYRCGGHALLRVDRGGAAGPTGSLPPGALERVTAAEVLVVADYGRGLAGRGDVRAAVASRRSPTVWDPHPRGPAPVHGVTLVTPNRSELEQLVVAPAGPPSTAQATTDLARTARAQWGVRAVAATLGSDGALLVDGDGPPLVVPARARLGDPCGAGDRFATAAARGLLAGVLLSEAVVAAVEVAGEFVAAGGAASVADPRPAPAAGAGPGPAGDPTELSASVRAGGGRVVVAGGCFDLLHAGHVSLLQAARRLGDCLIVALNSDQSVRRLKGKGRPVVGQDDRVSMLDALSCVDGVVVFGEDSPAEALRALRPHVFVKGGDYSNRTLPEEEVMRAWGGQVVVLPYLSGRSTTGLVSLAGAAR